MRTYDRIYAIVRQIPRGQVATYGQVAELSGLVGKPRLVGYALYRVDMATSDVPWQRVINTRGEVSQSPLRNGTDYMQRALLEDEGIEFDHRGRVNLSQYKWRPPEKIIEQALASFRETDVSATDPEEPED
jgi:methylated-DNA-protein-cysteine methyltransferase related protein